MILGTYHCHANSRAIPTRAVKSGHRLGKFTEIKLNTPVFALTGMYDDDIYSLDEKRQ